MALASSPAQTVATAVSTAASFQDFVITAATAGAEFVFFWGGLSTTAQRPQPSCPGATAVVTWVKKCFNYNVQGIGYEVWVGRVSGAGDTGTTLRVSTTVGINFNVDGVRGMFYEWDGAFDAQFDFALAQGNGATATTPSLTPVAGVPGVVIAHCRGQWVPGAVTSNGAGWTDPNTQGSIDSRFAYKYAASLGGAYSNSWTASGGSSIINDWIAMIWVMYETNPAKLVITQQPTNATSGVAIAPSITVEARTNGLVADATFTGNIDVAIATGSGVLGGTHPRAAAAGVGTFNDLTVTGSGAHTLQFTATGYASVASSSFTITAGVTATQCLIFTQPSPSIASGSAQSVVAKAYAADGVTVVTSYTGAAALTLFGPNGSVAGTISGSCVAGVFNFAPVPTADGPGFFYHVAMAGLTPADTSTFTVIGAVVAAMQAFVTAMGGNAKMFNIHDPRIYGNGAAPTLTDVIGPIGGRSPGISCSGTGITIAGGKIVIAAASFPDYESAADARLAMLDTFGAPRAVWDLVIAEATAAGPLVGIAKDPQSTAQYPSSYVKPAGSTWQVEIASDGATPTPTNPPIPNTAGIFTNDTGTPFAGGAIRAMAVGKMAYQTPAADQGNNINHVYGFLPFMEGKQPRFHHRVKPPTGGNNKLVYGRQGTSYGTGKVHWRGQYTGDWTLTQSLAFIAMARAQFGATIDVVAVPSFAISGNSYVNSTTQQPGGDMQSPTYGSGTTSFPYYMANYGGGSRSSLLAMGLDVGEVHSFAYGRSGGDLDYVSQTFDVELALLADGTRTGKVLIAHFDIGNSIAGGGMDQTSYLAGAVALKAQCDALATASGLTVNLLHILDSDRVGYYNASWPTIPTGYSVDGTDRVNIGAAMLASPLTYGAAVFDAATIASQAIGNFAAPRCYSATFYNINANGAFGGGDATHEAPAGYSDLGVGAKAFLDSHWGLLFTASLQPVLLNQTRRRAA